MPFYRIVFSQGKVLCCTQTLQTLPSKEKAIMFDPKEDALMFALVKASTEKEARKTIKMLSKTS